MSLRWYVTASLFLSVAGWAQTASDGEKKFDVVSIKPYDPSTGYVPGAFIGTRFFPDRFEAGHVPLKSLIAMAYNVDVYQVHGPAWIGSYADGFNVQAKAAGPASKDEMRAMLRTMLAERFQLVLHREPSETQVFALTVDKGGLKISKVAPNDDAPPDQKPKQLHFKMDMVALASRLSDFIRTPLMREDDTFESAGAVLPVVDQTGLEGKYDFRLHFPPPLEGDLFSTWQREIQTLGLKMVTKKVTMEGLIVDRVARPTEN